MANWLDNSLSINMAEYNIKLAAFEGPLDLLMHLIEKNKINIYDIPIAELTEQYLGYLEQFKEFNIEIASEFLVMAATLLQIKSRILLPKSKVSVDSETNAGDEVDPRQELVERLLEYRKFKEVCTVLDKLANDQAKFFFRTPQQLKLTYPPLDSLSVESLIVAFQSVLEAHEENEITLVTRERFSVQDKMAEIIVLLKRQKHPLNFSDVFTNSYSRAELIVAFLAILELLKQHEIKVEQKQPFAPIIINLRKE